MLLRESNDRELQRGFRFIGLIGGWKVNKDQLQTDHLTSSGKSQGEREGEAEGEIRHIENRERETKTERGTERNGERVR